MAARKKPTTEAVTFKIGNVQYRTLTGQGRDFLQCKPKDAPWTIMSDPEVAAVVARLEEQVTRLKPA